MSPARCPHCETYEVEATAALAPGKGRTVYWQRTGDTFETLTLTPSVDAASHGVGHWHGFITNGEIR